jgi:hypothetical protein
MRRPALLLAAASLALASCWAPYYDPEISASVGFAKKLGDPLLSIGPVSIEGGFDLSSDDVFEFLPERPFGNPASPKGGFLVLRKEDSIGIAFVEAEGGSRISLGMQGQPNYFGSGALLRAEASTADGRPQMMAVTEHECSRQYRYDRSTRSFMQFSQPNASSTCARVYGVGAVLVDPVTDADLYSALFSDGSQVLASAAVAGSALGSFSNLYAGLGVNTGGRGLGLGDRAFFDSGLERFYYSRRGAKTLRWFDSGLPGESPAELNIDRQLDFALSDGTLVAQDELRLYAYKASGPRLFTALSGSIRIRHEVYSPGPSPAAGYYLLFSQVLASGRGNSGELELLIKVWRCPLSDFRDFGD